MKQHKYLMMISCSPVRSSGHGTSNHVLKKEPCIVLYVLVKGYIPIHEDPFEESYSGVPVDVQEGLFRFFTGTAEDYHENVRHGCQIHKQQLGTLGGFIDYYGFGTCGLTCAHVLLSSQEMASLNPEATSTDDNVEITPEILTDVYQPNCSQKERNVLGTVIKAFYSEGGNGESGIDVAAFQIKQRYPLTGDFPVCRDGSNPSVSFDTRKTVKFTSKLTDGKLMKFGASTDITYGQAVLQCNSMSVKTYENYEDSKEYRVILHNLLEIKTMDEQRSFADFGDSGALVFCEGENDDLFCLGMVEGGTTQHTCAVMPIKPLLSKFNVNKFKNFQKNRIWAKLQTIEEKINEISNSQQTILQAINKLHSQ